MWPVEIFPKPNLPAYEDKLPFVYMCQNMGCYWLTFHKTEAGAEAERERHIENELCPYKNTSTFGGRNTPMPTLQEQLWDEMDRATKNVVETKPRLSELNEDQLEGYHLVRGQCQGLATAIVLLSVPYFEDARAVAKHALRRYAWKRGDIEEIFTPGCNGYRPPPPPAKRDSGKAAKPAVGITGVPSSSPKDNPKYGKFRALTEDEKQTIGNMYGRFPDDKIMALLKISKEQLAAEITKHEQPRDEVCK